VRTVESGTRTLKDATNEAIRDWVTNVADTHYIIGSVVGPDPSTAMLDPFTDVPTLVMVADIIDPITKQHYERDPRWIARKAENYLKMTGAGDQAFFGAEAEFFIFDNISFDQSYNYGFYYIDAEEGRWNSSRKENNLGYRPRHKEGYFPVPPTDHHQNIRTEMVEIMQRCGLTIECHHHEVATGGQCEIDQKFDTLVRSADNMMIYKYVARNVAFQHGRTVTFMPKPLFNDNGVVGCRCRGDLTVVAGLGGRCG
jgi:glutamine synthetase